ncbi:MFS transporter [Parabacteroides sp. FAFU027]|uniref:MFS transporter n=1 Tax=Parabacteroides sp. FAFU027 TaxID=2922715 RepID=UPI001FAF7AD8|nr:MFS transporter [Parabacteroides sp. FAFU027]
MKQQTSTLTILPVLFGFFIMGFCDVVGITSTHVKADFGLSDTLSNMIPVALFSMFLLFSVPTGMLMNKIGRKRTVLLSNAVTMVAMLIPLLSYTFATSLAAFVLLGIANTILQVSLNPLLTNVVKGDKLTSSLTAGQFVKAISSFSGPFIAAFAASRLGNWQYIFPIYALITLVSTIWLLTTSIHEEISVNTASSFGSVFGILKDKTLLLLFLGIVFVVGVDVGINTAAPKILMERCGMNTIDAGYGTSMYFAFRTAGAFIGAILLARYSAARFFKITTVVAVIALAALLFASGQVAVFALLAIIGFSIANVFSIIFAMAIQLHPDKGNEISGLMITGVFGGAVIPFIMGVASDAVCSQVGSVTVILLSAIYLLFCSFAVKPKL